MGRRFSFIVGGIAALFFFLKWAGIFDASLWLGLSAVAAGSFNALLFLAQFFLLLFAAFSSLLRLTIRLTDEVFRLVISECSSS